MFKINFILPFSFFLKISIRAYNLIENSISSKYIFVKSNKIEVLFSNCIFRLPFQRPSSKFLKMDFGKWVRIYSLNWLLHLLIIFWQTFFHACTIFLLKCSTLICSLICDMFSINNLFYNRPDQIMQRIHIMGSWWPFFRCCNFRNAIYEVFNSIPGGMRPCFILLKNEMLIFWNFVHQELYKATHGNSTYAD